MNAPSPMRCDECGHDVASIHRVHKGIRYCTTCYARVFKRRICSKCGESARLPKNDPDPICRHCEVAKACARCGKSDYAIGKITSYGPVCNACAPHFREAEPCEACGRMSRRLTRVRRFGHGLRLCPRCARNDYGTCAACRRYRPLGAAVDGRQLCRACANKGEIPCPSCGGPMPAGRGGSLCEMCYWTKTLWKRIQMDQAAFSTVAMRSAFRDFGKWLEVEVGASKAARSIHRYLPFFMQMEENWRRIPTYPPLLECFGAEGLRRVRLPMRWLCEDRGVKPDANARKDDSERRRIETLRRSLPAGSRASKIFEEYQQTLMARHEAGRTSLRSIRFALWPAMTLLLRMDPQGRALPDQAALDRYLLHAPGQKAAVTGFVNYLSATQGLTLEPRVDTGKVVSARRRALENEITRMTRQPGYQRDVDRRWIAVGIEYFHHVKVSKRTLASASVSDDGHVLRVAVNGATYVLPKRRWQADGPICEPQA